MTKNPPPKCPIHERELVCLGCLGQRGGAARTKRKVEASAQNARKATGARMAKRAPRPKLG
jgi:hypothetical protein